MKEQDSYVEKIRNSYTPHETTKLDELKTLDKKVKQPVTVFAYVFGSVAALILGVGMCLAMKIIGASLMSPAVLITLGVIIGCLGIGLCIANYFIYNAMLKSRKRKYGNRIVSLSNELLNEEEE